MLAEVVSLPLLTWGRLHTDPAPEAFLHDAASGVTGLIDWAGACPGPLLYDVASAVMYLGGLAAAEPFLAAYLSTSPLPRAELIHLPTWLRYRGAVQAAYFADRVVRADLTGTDAAGNRTGPRSRPGDDAGPLLRPAATPRESRESVRRALRQPGLFNRLDLVPDPPLGPAVPGRPEDLPPQRGARRRPAGHGGRVSPPDGLIPHRNRRFNPSSQRTRRRRRFPCCRPGRRSR